MALIDEVQAARKKVVTDGYDMSLGELINLYREGELKIDPIFQRLFRWDDERKTSFIESILLGIPFPPIFVFQDENGVWELVDGLQRLSTVLQLTGDLMSEGSKEIDPLVLNGTHLLPSLDGKRWQNSTEATDDGIGQALQIWVKRARVRVEILKSGSDSSAKYELFQRLNTGGVSLTAQEVRNSIAVTLNRPFYHWLLECANQQDFRTTTAQTEAGLETQAHVELALRFFAFREVTYKAGLDVHEYLDQAMMYMLNDQNYGREHREREGEVFTDTFHFLADALRDAAFKRWTGSQFIGKFLMSVYEVLATGVSKNIDKLRAMDSQARRNFIEAAARNLWSNALFMENSGAGVRGTTRLSKLLPIASDLLDPTLNQG